MKNQSVQSPSWGFNQGPGKDRTALLAKAIVYRVQMAKQQKILYAKKVQNNTTRMNDMITKSIQNIC